MLVDRADIAAAEQDHVGPSRSPSAHARQVRLRHLRTVRASVGDNTRTI